MNAFEAAEADGRAEKLQTELESLFEQQNTSRNSGSSIPAAFPGVAGARVVGGRRLA
jgi:hypothetical protein